MCDLEYFSNITGSKERFLETQVKNHLNATQLSQLSNLPYTGSSIIGQWIKNGDIHCLVYVYINGYYAQPTAYQTLVKGNRALNLAGWDDIEKWDTSKVKNMSGLFQNSNFNADISDWDVSKVDDFSHMFDNAKEFDIYLNWNGIGTNLVYHSCNINENCRTINMSYMFRDATSFNQKLDWNFEKVDSMAGMFKGATNFNNGSPKGKQNDANTFGNTTNQSKNGFLTNTQEMFEGAESFNQKISPNLNMTNLNYMEKMFRNATSFNQTFVFYSENVQNLSSMFEGATSFNNGSVSGSEPLHIKSIGGVVLVTLDSMFKGATSFNQPINLQIQRDFMRLSTVVTLDSMFKGATNFNQPINFNLVNINTIKISDIFKNATNFNQDLREFIKMINYNVENINEFKTIFGLGDNYKSECLNKNFYSPYLICNCNKAEPIKYIINSNCDFLKGCTDKTACNYNGEATYNDGSCEYADQGYDCDGNCLDADSNGICDKDEILGCTHTDACNYDKKATDDDGSCTFSETQNYNCKLGRVVIELKEEISNVDLNKICNILKQKYQHLETCELNEDFNQSSSIVLMFDTNKKNLPEFQKLIEDIELEIQKLKIQKLEAQKKTKKNIIIIVVVAIVILLIIVFGTIYFIKNKK